MSGDPLTSRGSTEVKTERFTDVTSPYRPTASKATTHNNPFFHRAMSLQPARTFAAIGLPMAPCFGESPMRAMPASLAPLYTHERHQDSEENMEGDYFTAIGTVAHLQDNHDTVVSRSPDSLPSPVEIALSMYADSIEGLTAGCGREADGYTRGFIAGLRAGMKFAANEMRG